MYNIIKVFFSCTVHAYALTAEEEWLSSPCHWQLFAQTMERWQLWCLLWLYQWWFFFRSKLLVKKKVVHSKIAATVAAKCHHSEQMHMHDVFISVSVYKVKCENLQTRFLLWGKWWMNFTFFVLTWTVKAVFRSSQSKKCQNFCTFIELGYI